MAGEIVSERPGDFKSEWWARSSRNAGRHRAESAKVKPAAELRDYLAEERTFLAWIRTGIALMGFGFVLVRFGIFGDELQVTHLTTASQPPTGPHSGLGPRLSQFLIPVRRTDHKHARR
jgi:hypothetical protein